MKKPIENNQIEIFSQQIQAKEKAITRAMLDAFRNNRRKEAKEHFELACQYNEFNELCKHFYKAQPRENNSLELSLDAWFLQDLIRHLTPHEDEEVVYVTGYSFENLRIPYRICGFELDEQSVVYAKGTTRSCSDALIEIIEKGYKLMLVAHSHPGNGPGATSPSGIDINYLDKIQRNGSEAIGLIVTRDGYVRVFTSRFECKVSIKGMEVEHVGDNVFKIPLV